MNLVEQKLERLSQLCKEHKVKNMYLFGSVLNENFSVSSDIDFLVNFNKIPLKNYFDNYISLKNGLENLYIRSVDLVEDKTVRNPVLRRSIDRNKKLIYGRVSDSPPYARPPVIPRLTRDS